MIKNINIKTFKKLTSLKNDIYKNQVEASWDQRQSQQDEQSKN